MFGIVVSGRPVITEALSPSPGKFAFQLAANPPFSSLAVFLLPGAALPPDQAAAIYVQVPPAPDFALVGALANDKQSAIIRVRDNSSSTAANGVADQDDMVDEAPPPGDVVVGLSVEPAALVAQQLDAAKSRSVGVAASNALVRAAPPPVPSARGTAKAMAQRIIGNAFNYLASFEGPDGKVPMKSFQEWWKKFEKKVDMDPSFLERVDDGA